MARASRRVLDTRAYAGIVAYEPTELVITVRCGTPLAELEAVLAARGSTSRFRAAAFRRRRDRRRHGRRRTCPGRGVRRRARCAISCWACACSTGAATISFGGQVMKNVAGYDVSRPIAGSLGTLGLILEVSLKVPPLPFAEATLEASNAHGQGALRCSTTGAEGRCRSAPVPGPAANSTCACRARRARSRRRARRSAASSCADQAQRYWRGIREQSRSFLRPTNPCGGCPCLRVAAAARAPGRGTDRVGRRAQSGWRAMPMRAPMREAAAAARRACHPVSRGGQERGRVHAA